MRGNSTIRFRVKFIICTNIKIASKLDKIIKYNPKKYPEQILFSPGQRSEFNKERGSPKSTTSIHICSVDNVAQQQLRFYDSFNRPRTQRIEWWLICCSSKEYVELSVHHHHWIVNWFYNCTALHPRNNYYSLSTNHQLQWVNHSRSLRL